MAIQYKKKSNNDKNKIMNEYFGTEVTELKSLVAGIIKHLGLTFSELDTALGKYQGYTAGVLKRSKFTQISKLHREIYDHIGFGTAKKDFKEWIKTKGITIASLSNVLFPDKSSSYLAGILNEDSTTFNDFKIFELFQRTAKDFSDGKIKIISDLKSGKKSLSSQLAEGVETEDTQDLKEENEQKEETTMNYLIITNFNTKKQEIVNIGNRDFKEFSDFYDKVKVVMGISDEDVTIVPLAVNEAQK